MPSLIAKGHDITHLAYLHQKVDSEKLFEKGEHSVIFDELQSALDASKKHSTDKDTILFASATIKRILTIINNAKQNLPSRFFSQLILYIERIWDYQADIVCHEAVDSFSLLINLHLRQCQFCLERKPDDNAANCDRINEIVQWLLEPSATNRSRFRCLLSFVTLCPSLCINLSENFFKRIYNLLNNPRLSNVICELIIVDLLDDDNLWDFHASAIKDFVEKHDTSVVKYRLLQMIQKKPKLRPFLQLLLDEIKNTSYEAQDLDLLLEICRCLINTQKVAHKTKHDADNAAIISWVDLISHTSMLDAIIHVDTEVGVSAWKLIVEHPKTTLAFTETDIEFMKVFLDANMAVQSAAARNNILASLKVALLRIAEASEILLKTDDDLTTVDLYIVFVKDIAKSAFESLSPKGNYNRRIMALMMIEILYNRDTYVTNGKVRFVDKLKLDDTLGSDRLKMVLLCLNDSYDLCQSTALKILKTIDFGHVDLDEDDYLRESKGLMSSMNFRNTSASGYRMQYFMSRHPERLQPLLTKFLGECEVATQSAEKKLLNITEVAIHPLLNTIEHLLKNSEFETLKNADEEKVEWWKRFVTEQLLPMCFRIVKVVTPVVHDVSPEGYIPDDKLADMNGESVGIYAELSQHLLLCCWRAHKHISAIFSWCIKVLAPRDFLLDDDVCNIGQFYWNQLTECKHRGAFECAVEGFTEMCRFLWISKNSNHPRPDVWLTDILSAISGKKDLSNLCSTRRSAGLPYLVVAIISTEPNDNQSAALKKAVDSLLDMTDKELQYRIHSINVMKAIIMSASLRGRIPFACEKTLFVAINACRSEWSERNAASQLFSALRTRIFGVTRTVQRSLTVDPKNRQSNYEFFSKYPSLYKFLYDQLFLDRSEFSLLPTLVLLTHLNSPPSSSDSYPLSAFVPALLRIGLHEKRENLRSHACAAIMAISDIPVKNDVCDWILEFDITNSRQNHIHCFLLLISGFVDLDSHMEVMIKRINDIVTSDLIKKWSDYNINLALTLANRLNIQFDIYDVPIETIVLSKRPVAYQLLVDRDALKIETSGLLKDREIRKEVYRTVKIEGWAICNRYLCAHILSLATKDLELSAETGEIAQSEAKVIMDILSAADDYMNDSLRKQLNAIVTKSLENPDSTWTLSSTRSSAIQIKYMDQLDTHHIDFELTDWIEECFESEDLEAKAIALNVGCRFVGYLQPNITMSPSFYKPIELKLIEVVALYLQDDDYNNRKKASIHLSHLVNAQKRMPLNPAVCRLLISKWILKKSSTSENQHDDFDDMREHDESMEDDIGNEDRDELFDACSLNQYSESTFFGDIRLYESLLQRMNVAADVFELEMD